MGELKKIFVLLDGDGNFRGDMFTVFVNRANAEAELRKHAGQIVVFQQIDSDVQPDEAGDDNDDGPFPDGQDLGQQNAPPDLGQDDDDSDSDDDSDDDDTQDGQDTPLFTQDGLDSDSDGDSDDQSDDDDEAPLSDAEEEDDNDGVGNKYQSDKFI